MNYDGIFILSQSLAFFAFALGIYAFQKAERSKILAIICTSGFINALHFILLHATSGAIFSALTASRMFVASRTTSRKALVSMILIISAIFILMTSGRVGLLPFLGTAIGTIGAFENCTSRVRLCLLVGAILWAIECYLVGSPVGLIMNLTFAASNLIGYLRHRDTSVVD